ncbi:SDR family oxidoreductase [Streptomyces sp. NBC_00988]|uniref:SDR family oxidoreductase n=1 Tax=Streptomyces sp. NBC_00988 TaxID=2903704 RepID=UPI00386C8338|nr:SDR family oxidoreductase [Streptomyces sp. NBC_00988]
MTDLKNAVVLVTGANGGLGREFVAQALARGAAKVYATARTPQVWDADRVVPLTLDITNQASVTQAATEAGDVTVLINNAGASTGASLLSEDLEAAKALFDTNFWGQLHVSNTFAPVLAANGGGAFLNVLSVLSWLGIADAYSATKAAFWSATNTQRLALAKQGTQVTGLHLGYTDTPMTAGLDTEKNDPADIVAAAYDGLVAGDPEVLADETSRQVKAGLAAPVQVLYAPFAG